MYVHMLSPKTIKLPFLMRY